MVKGRAPEGFLDTDDSVRAEEAQSMVEGFLGNKLKKKPKKQSVSNSQWEHTVQEVQLALEGGGWENTKPLHFVALYELLHEKVYGVKPTELGPTDRLHASGMAGRLLEREFGGDRKAFSEFMRWTWIREETREKWRVEHNRDGGRLGWKLMFNGSLLTDYRVSAKRRKP